MTRIICNQGSRKLTTTLQVGSDSRHSGLHKDQALRVKMPTTCIYQSAIAHNMPSAHNIDLTQTAGYSGQYGSRPSSVVSCIRHILCKRLLSTRPGKANEFGSRVAATTMCCADKVCTHKLTNDNMNGQNTSATKSAIF